MLGRQREEKRDRKKEREREREREREEKKRHITKKSHKDPSILYYVYIFKKSADIQVNILILVSYLFFITKYL